MKRSKNQFKLSLVAILLLLSMLLSACGTKKGDDGKTDQDKGQTIPAGVDITLVKDGTASFDIILPKDATDTEKQSAEQLRDRVKSTTKGAEAEIKNAGTYDEKKVEILIGNTGYPESDAIYNSIGYGVFVVRVVGHKLVVAANLDEYYSDALVELYMIIRKEFKDGTLIFKGDTNITIVKNPNINAIPFYTDGTFAYAQETGTLTGRADQITFSETTQEYFETYKKVLADAGYKTIQTNKIGQNDFITVSNGKKLITAYHMGLLGETRIIAENDRDFAHPDSIAYETVNDTTLWQLGLGWDREADLVYRMNAYVIKLADGRFILHDTGTRAASSYIYEYLRANTPEGEKIRVAAVIISHPHTDHMYGLLEMAEIYTKDQIEIEAAYFNYGAASMQSGYTSARLRELWSNCKNAAEKFGAKCYVARTGMKLQIANATVEFMWTVDDYGTVVYEETNDSSAVTRITVNGQKMLFLGDHTVAPSLINASMYGQELKSDMVTIAHHGMSGSAWEFYQLVQPTIAFWPNRWYEENETNTKLRAMECIKQHYLAGDGDVVITLQTK